VKHILIVCTANICRSPMAAAILRQRLAGLGLAGEVEVKSAGVFAQEGEEPSGPAVAVLAKRNVPLDDHRSQPVTAGLLAEADLVLVMAEAHRRSLFYLAPQHLGKVFLLAEMSGAHYDVPDPFGGPVEGYMRTADLLDKMIEAGLPAILERLRITLPAQDGQASISQ
jgi:protein-tyrosine-phosphatase